jgi:hypothetical protein
LAVGGAHFASSAPTAPGALHRGHRPQWAAELRYREKVMGTTWDACRSARIRYVRSAAADTPAGVVPLDFVPRSLTERSDLMTNKICFDCFHKLFPDKPIRKVTLGRQCVVCKAQTDRTEQMIPVEAEDIPPVKQIASESENEGMQTITSM